MKELRKKILEKAKSIFSENEYKRFYQTIRTLETHEVSLEKTFYIVDGLLDFFPVFFTVQLALFTQEEDSISTEIKKRYLNAQQRTELKKIIELKSIRHLNKKHESQLLKFLFEAFLNDTQLIYYFLAERFAESKNIHDQPLAYKFEYAKELFEIVSPLAHRMGIRVLKDEFDRIGFSLLFNEDYLNLKEQKEEYFKSSRAFMTRISDKIKYHLHKSNLKEFTFENRVKNIYSIYKKLKYKGRNDIKSINDIFAIRVVVPTISDCYTVFGIIHMHFPHLRGKVKDYISLPKPNSYQSLHTILQIEHEGMFIPVEIQIRTEYMHRVAESGLASHFFYKLEGGGISGKYSQREMKKQLKKISDHFSQSTFLQKAERDLFLKYIFVFSKDKSIFPLPKGSTVLDFAFLLHSDIGKYCKSGLIGGREVSLDHILRNGDTIEIQVSKIPQIEQKWIHMARCPEVIKKIKSELPKEIE